MTDYEKRGTMAKGLIQKHGIDFSEVYNRLKNQEYVSKSNLKNIFVALNPQINETQVRSVIYSLEKGNYISTSGSGVFTVLDPQNKPSVSKSRFNPKNSTSLNSIVNRINTAFPYLECVFWETIILHDFMVNQPKINMIILDIEKGSEMSVFDFLQQETTTDVFIFPDSITVERYVSAKDKPVIISNLVSQAPRANKGKMHHYARIEKILVDILVDKTKFFPYQGEELVNIYENVFERLVVNEDSLIRYAQRRTAVDTLKNFILSQTNIKIRKFIGEINDHEQIQN